MENEMAYKALTSGEIQKSIKFVEETLCVAEGVCPHCNMASKYYVVLTKPKDECKEVDVGCKIKKKEVKKTEKK
jgi:hypothetical protein